MNMIRLIEIENLALLLVRSVGVGGSLGRTEATGYGVVYCIREALKRLGLNFKDATASIQGAGNVAQYSL